MAKRGSEFFLGLKGAFHDYFFYLFIYLIFFFASAPPLQAFVNGPLGLSLMGGEWVVVLGY